MSLDDDVIDIVLDTYTDEGVRLWLGSWLSADKVLRRRMVAGLKASR